MPYKRICNKEFLKIRLRMFGYTEESLGAACDPPLGRAAISHLISPTHPFKTEKRIKEVSGLLHASDVLLFPFLPVPAFVALSSKESAPS